MGVLLGFVSMGRVLRSSRDLGGERGVLYGFCWLGQGQEPGAFRCGKVVIIIESRKYLQDPERKKIASRATPLAVMESRLGIYNLLKIS